MARYQGSSWYIVDIALIVITCLAFVLLVIGFAIPDWIYAVYNDNSGTNNDHDFHMSIWYTSLCPASDTDCTRGTHGDLSQDLTTLNDPAFTTFAQLVVTNTNGDLDWDAWQAESTISVILAFFGCLTALYMVCSRTRYYMFCAGLGFLLMLLASILMWIPVGMIAEVNDDLKDDFSAINTANTANNDTLEMKSPSGLIIAAIGAFFALVSALIFLVYICFRPSWRNKRRRYPRRRPSISISEESRYVYNQPVVHYEEPRRTVAPQYRYYSGTPYNYGNYGRYHPYSYSLPALSYNLDNNIKPYYHNDYITKPFGNEVVKYQSSYPALGYTGYYDHGDDYYDKSRIVGRYYVDGKDRDEFLWGGNNGHQDYHRKYPWKNNIRAVQSDIYDFRPYRATRKYHSPYNNRYFDDYRSKYPNIYDESRNDYTRNWLKNSVRGNDQYYHGKDRETRFRRRRGSYSPPRSNYSY